jgi:hypothetical protein
MEDVAWPGSVEAEHSTGLGRGGFDDLLVPVLGRLDQPVDSEPKEFVRLQGEDPVLAKKDEQGDETSSGHETGYRHVGPGQRPPARSFGPSTARATSTTSEILPMGSARSWRSRSDGGGRRDWIGRTLHGHLAHAWVGNATVSMIGISTRCHVVPSPFPGVPGLEAGPNHDSPRGHDRIARPCPLNLFLRGSLGSDPSGKGGQSC